MRGSVKKKGGEALCTPVQLGPNGGLGAGLC